MEEYRIDLKVRNNLILTKIESLGYSSLLSFCKSSGFTYQSLMKLANMKTSIFDVTGNIKPFVKKLCDHLNCLPEEIFSCNQMEASLSTNKKTLKVKEAEMMFLMNCSSQENLLEHIVEQKQLQEKTKELVDTLTPRERKILNMRYGLAEHEGQEHTYKQIGNKFDIGTERVRQIIAKALRKLRHPSRSEELRVFLNRE